jgi:epoxyqueuosine reductase
LRGAIPEELRDGIGNHIFGCDVCQEVCPWNGAASRTADLGWSSHQKLNRTSLVDLWRRSDADLRELSEDTPLTRSGVKGLRRNLAVALGNSGDPRALDALGEDRSDETANDSLVVEHVQWAKSRL